MQFRELSQFLRGNPTGYTSELPADVEVLHVIEESRAVQGVAVILGSKEWAPAPMGSLIPEIFLSMEMYVEPDHVHRINALKATEWTDNHIEKFKEELDSKLRGPRQEPPEVKPEVGPFPFDEKGDLKS